MKNRITTAIFIERAKKIYGNKYDYSKVDYKASNKKIIIICPIHGEFLQVANDHTRKNGCRKCGNVKLTKEEFIIRAKKIYIKRN